MKNTKTPEDFTKKLKKLENYFILHEEDEYLIMGTTIKLKEHMENHSTFSTYAVNVEREILTFFVLELNEKCAKINELRKNKVPVVSLPQSIAGSKINTIKTYLQNELFEKGIR